jgi:hypothetical protein
MDTRDQACDHLLSLKSPNCSAPTICSPAWQGWPARLPLPVWRSSRNRHNSDRRHRVLKGRGNRVRGHPPGRWSGRGRHGRSDRWHTRSKRSFLASRSGLPASPRTDGDARVSAGSIAQSRTPLGPCRCAALASRPVPHLSRRGVTRLCDAPTTRNRLVRPLPFGTQAQIPAVRGFPLARPVAFHCCSRSFPVCPIWYPVFSTLLPEPPVLPLRLLLAFIDRGGIGPLSDRSTGKLICVKSLCLGNGQSCATSENAGRCHFW